MHRLIALGIASVLAFSATGCGNDQPHTVDLPSSDVQVRYLVDGSAPYGSVTVQTPTGISQQDIDVPMKNKTGSVGLQYTFDRGDAVYIAAQKGTEDGEITCRIEVDGHVVSENTSSAAFGIATCRGRAS